MLGYLLIAAALALGLGSGKDVSEVARLFVLGLTGWSTVQLIGVVALIEMLTVFLQKTGGLQRMLAALRGVIDNARVLVALVPSILGLLPVPGGAVLSAPMVGAYGDEIGMDRERKASVNLFFRHIWDLVFPFKPHLILAATVLNLPLFALIGWQLPVTLASACFGYWFLVARIPSGGRAEHQVEEAGDGSSRLWVDAAPLVLPMILALVLRIDFLWALALGLLVGLVSRGFSGTLLREMVIKGIQPRLLFSLAAVMIFKTVVESTGVVQAVATILTGEGASLTVLALVLPFAVGLATGLELVAVGIVFPLLTALVPSGASPIPFIIVMMISNGIAQTLSPAHVCMIAGNEYFGVGLWRVVRLNAAPMIFRLGAGALFAWTVGTFLAV